MHIIRKAPALFIRRSSFPDFQLTLKCSFDLAGVAISQWFLFHAHETSRLIIQSRRSHTSRRTLFAASTCTKCPESTVPYMSARNVKLMVGNWVILWLCQSRTAVSVHEDIWIRAYVQTTRQENWVCSMTCLSISKCNISANQLTRWSTSSDSPLLSPKFLDTA